MPITYNGKQYREDGAPLDASGNVQMGGSWINPNYAHAGGILTDSSGARFDAGSIGANGGMQIRPDAQFGAPATTMRAPASNYSYNDPRMKSDYASYFQNSTPGQEQAWGGGTLTRMANGSANYMYGGQSHLIDANTDIGSLAAFSPELASELQRNYPGQSAPGAQAGGNLHTMPYAMGAAPATGYAPQGQLGGASGYGSYGGYGAGSGPYSAGSNPYLSDQASAITRRMTDNLRENVLPQIGSNFVGDGYGGSRMEIAQQRAIKSMNLGLGDSLAQMYGTDWTNQQNRNLTRYGLDQNYDLGSQNTRNNFYTQQRGQDLQQYGLASDMIGAGINNQWAPLLNAGRSYAPLTNNGTTNLSGQSGGGAMGAIGGALGVGQFAQNMGWFGNQARSGPQAVQPGQSGWGW